LIADFVRKAFVTKFMDSCKNVTSTNRTKMAKSSKKGPKLPEKDVINAEIRKKLGLTQAQLAAILGVSRAGLALSESGKRTLHSTAHILLLNMFLQFHELETGKQASYRSLETRLFLNDEYKKILPEMNRLEKDCRHKMKALKESMTTMKERARDTEHAIIVLTTVINNLQENKEAGNQKKERMVTGLNLMKQKAYDNLLTCWEPEQAKLQCKIEAASGEARALRRYRLKVMKEHGPFRKEAMKKG